ncbi:MAG TPA: hypothetical protein VGH07_03555, partial [Chthoniobacterales bacterium]
MKCLGTRREGIRPGGTVRLLGEDGRYFLDANKIWVTDHTVPSGTDSDVDPSQAFHAWLPS